MTSGGHNWWTWGVQYINNILDFIIRTTGKPWNCYCIGSQLVVGCCFCVPTVCGGSELYGRDPPHLSLYADNGPCGLGPMLAMAHVGCKGISSSAGNDQWGL